MKTVFILILCSLLAVACNKNDSVPPPGSDYLPLEIGNYWKVDDDDYVEVTGTEVINGQTFFVSRSRNKDGYNPGLQDGNLYFRIDDGKNLIQGYKNQTFTKNIADFTLAKGRKVNALENPTVTEKTAGYITFRYDCMICSQSNTYYYATFIRGKGFAERNFMLAGSLSLVKKFTEVKIGGKIYKM